MLNYKKVAVAAVIGSMIISASPVLAEDPLSALMGNILEAAGEEQDQAADEAEAIQDVQQEAVPEEAVQEEAAPEEAVTEEADIAEPADPSDLSSLIGRWYGLQYEGNSDYRVSGEFYAMPDLTLVRPDSDEMYSITPSDKPGTWTIPVPEELSDKVSSIRIETGTLDAAIEDDLATFLQTDSGSDCLRLIVTALSKDNPLAGDEETVSLFLRYDHESGYLKECMGGKIWKIGDNTLTIGADDSLDLNSGKATGRCNYTFDDDHSMLVTFRWDGGSSVITYVPSDFTANGLTLTNLDNPSDVMELVLEGDAPAVEADSEAAA